VSVRRRVRETAAGMGFSLVDQTKVVTAASELARNTLIHGGGGEMELTTLNGPRSGLRLAFQDKGPGIPNIELALRDGFTTGSGLGLGLGGAKRLVNEFDITSRPGEGTRVTITRWK
jgi:serine/threonine-protein kinase RsbT